jgi:hypothetical protein
MIVHQMKNQKKKKNKLDVQIADRDCNNGEIMILEVCSIDLSNLLDFKFNSI